MLMDLVSRLEVSCCCGLVSSFGFSDAVFLSDDMTLIVLFLGGLVLVLDSCCCV